MSEEKISCFYCKHYFECEVRKAITEVKDAIDEASNYLNEYFVEDVFSKLDKIYDEVAKKCRNFEYESPTKKYGDILEDIKETVKNTMSILIPLLSLRAIGETFKEKEEHKQIDTKDD